MRSSKELIHATKQFAVENRIRSWSETILTIFLVGIALFISVLSTHLIVKIIASIICGFLYVRMFVIYHDFQHHAILQKSKLAEVIMVLFGIYILAPQNIWKRSHDHHHNNNSKLTLSGIGSYPTICTQRFCKLSKNEQRLYLLNRHPLTIIFGYFTLFIYWLNIKSFFQSPGKHLDSLVAIVFHVSVGAIIFYYFGWQGFILTWFFPFFLAFAIGSYLFYSQHNFPSAQFRENQDWTYDDAALSSTSFMKMHPVMNWLTGDIGYHHVHHMNSRIPFYRLKETMMAIPELQKVNTTSWSPFEIWKCFELKLWDAEKMKMIKLSELEKNKN